MLLLSNLWVTAGQVEIGLYIRFKGITAALWGLCWCTTLPSIWPMKMWSAGWRSWGTMQTATLLSCWLATKVTCAISGLCPLMRHAHLQVRTPARFGLRTGAPLPTFNWFYKYFDNARVKAVFYVACVLTWITRTLKYYLFEIMFFVSAEKNGLSFLETSALDSTNVETAFQTILTGEWTLSAGAVVLVCCSYMVRLRLNHIWPECRREKKVDEQDFMQMSLRKKMCVCVG